jgi:hypothetical protein
MAAKHGDAVLLHRVCLGQQCHAVFFICAHCDRGHRYCSNSCRGQSRRTQRRQANKRHQQSPEGQLDHRDGQRRYRLRCDQKQARVTDQGSLSITSPALFSCGPAEATTPIKIPSTAAFGLVQQPLVLLRCRICGRLGRFINPFPRIPRKRWLPE